MITLHDPNKRPIYGYLPVSPDFARLLERALSPIFDRSHWLIENETLYATYNVDVHSDNQMIGALNAVLSIYGAKPQPGRFVATHKIQAHGLSFFGRPVNEVEGNSAAEFDCVQEDFIKGQAEAPKMRLCRTRFNNGHIVTTLSVPRLISLTA